MGSCTSSVDGKTKKLQTEHDKAVALSRQLELQCTSPCELKLLVRELQTVLEVLQMVAQARGLPTSAAALLKMEFAEAVMAHDHTMKQAGICDQAQFIVLGEDAVKAHAQDVDIMEAAKQGNIGEVQLVVALAPKVLLSPCSVAAL